MIDKVLFWAFIKKQRKRHGYSITDIAQLLELTRAGYIRKEKGENPFTLTEALALSYHLKFHLETIESFYLSNH